MKIDKELRYAIKMATQQALTDGYDNAVLAYSDGTYGHTRYISSETRNTKEYRIIGVIETAWKNGILEAIPDVGIIKFSLNKKELLLLALDCIDDVQCYSMGLENCFGTFLLSDIFRKYNEIEIIDKYQDYIYSVNDEE